MKVLTRNSTILYIICYEKASVFAIFNFKSCIFHNLTKKMFFESCFFAFIIDIVAKVIYNLCCKIIVF